MQAKGATLRLFLDASILFSASCSDGAIRRLISELTLCGHVIVVDGYVWEEALRNVTLLQPSSLEFLHHLSDELELHTGSASSAVVSSPDWGLPAKDVAGFMLILALPMMEKLLLSGSIAFPNLGFSLFSGAPLAFGPFLYLYTRSVIHPGSLRSPRTLLHFLPVLASVGIALVIGLNRPAMAAAGPDSLAWRMSPRGNTKSPGYAMTRHPPSWPAWKVTCSQPGPGLMQTSRSKTWLSAWACHGTTSHRS